MTDVLNKPRGSAEAQDIFGEEFVWRTLAEYWRFKAEHDALTGLLNKSAWKDKLEQKIKIAETEGDSFAVIFVDLTRFKYGNDVLGHERIDQLLAKYGPRLKAHMRTGDFKDSPDLLAHEKTPKSHVEKDEEAARYGGDEFAIIADLIPREIRPETDSELSAQSRAEIIKQRLYEDFHNFMAEQEPEVQAVGMDIAIGYSIWEPSKSGTDMLKEADTNMYEHKQIQHATGGSSRR